MARSKTLEWKVVTRKGSEVHTKGFIKETIKADAAAASAASLALVVLFFFFITIILVCLHLCIPPQELCRMVDGASPFLPMALEHPLPDMPSSKRRWSPSTWRYAIEEVQPELANKPRAAAAAIAAPGERFFEPPRKPASPEKPADRGRHGCDQISAPGKQWVHKAGAHKGHNYADVSAKLQKKMIPGLQQTELLEEKMTKKDTVRTRRAEVKERHLGKRRKREMTPSELYFCEVCAGKASNGNGSHVGDD